MTCRTRVLVKPTDAGDLVVPVARAPGKPGSEPTRASVFPGRFGHDFAKVPALSARHTAGRPPYDQTPAPSAPEILAVGGEATGGSSAPVVDRVELVSSASGAVGGYPPQEDTCDASLNTPGPFNDTFHRGSVANVHQVHFHMSKGWSGDLRAKRMVKRTAQARGQQFDKSGDDGPPSHEYQFTEDRLVVADAPGWCRTLTESDFPVTYTADFSLYAFDPLTKAIVASIAYRVEIAKTHYSQRDPVNTVDVVSTKIGGGVPSPVPPKQTTK